MRLSFLTACCFFSSLYATSSPSEPPAFSQGALFDGSGQPGIRMSLDSEYLYWWTEDASLPVVVATEGSSTDAVPAALGQSGTKVLFGNEGIVNGALSGFRLALCSWFGENQQFGVEASGFYLPEKKTLLFSKSSAGVFGVPFDNVAPFPLPSGHGGWILSDQPGEAAVLLGFPPVRLAGSIDIHSTIQLWDVELNGLFQVINLPYFHLSVLGGFAYFDLSEELNFFFKSTNEPNAAFLSALLTDRFWTHNEVYTGQMGLRGEWSSKWWFASFLAKVGVGGAQQIVHVEGGFSDPIANIYYSYGLGKTGGIFTQATNIGEHKQGRFEVIPSLKVTAGVNLMRDLRLFVGYDILFLNTVLRPGEQIDHVINETQAGPNAGTTPILSGKARPRPLMETTTFWAQGIHVGLQGRF